MSYFLGIDLGGTNIKAVCVTEAGAIIDQASRATEDNASGIFAQHVAALVEELQRKHGEAARIGLSAPGLAARDGRSISFMPGRMQGLENLDWTDLLETKHSVLVLNDAHAALLGEIWLGAGKGVRNAFLLTLGTGVGGAAFCDGRLLKGQLGRAGHLGHISLDIHGAKDIVNTPGSLEDAIGECTIKARTSGAYASTRELVDAANRGDVRAKEIWLRSVHKLACAIASLINVLDPEVVIIGGGIAQAGAALFEPLEAAVRKFEWQPAGHRVQPKRAAGGRLRTTLLTLGQWKRC